MQELSFSLEIFEGPLELLLHLLKKNKVSIYDIPIESITVQYMEYLEKMEAFDMELSSEFLIMASELLYIKSKMLLPRHEEEDEDPRKNLADRLIEYQRMKTLAGYLKEHEEDSRYLFFKEPDAIAQPAPDYSDQTFDIERLMAAFSAKRYENAKENTTSLLKFSSLISFPLGIGMIFIGKPVMSLLYGENTSVSGGGMLCIYGFAAVACGICIAFTTLLQAVNKQNIAFLNFVFGLVLKLVFNFVLVGIPKLNIYGAALSTVICYIFVLIADLIVILKFRLMPNIFNTFLLT